ncbi:hypothetical protein OKW23_001297 [Bacilli bacterium PM5-9]|nr:hypothetical protein [Bacilli bacterium PM5-9]
MITERKDNIVTLREFKDNKEEISISMYGSYYFYTTIVTDFKNNTTLIKTNIKYLSVDTLFSDEESSIEDENEKEYFETICHVFSSFIDNHFESKSIEYTINICFFDTFQKRKNLLKVEDQMIALEKDHDFLEEYNSIENIFSDTPMELDDKQKEIAQKYNTLEEEYHELFEQMFEYL